MSTELGKIERPVAEQFREQRKIYLVPLVFAPRQPSPDYADIHERYWREVREQLLKLESSIGQITHVYHEAVGKTGEEGLDLAERVNQRSGSIARSKVEAGATLEALEDAELVAENHDWQRCLMVGLESQKVAELAWSSYTESTHQRYEIMGKRIDETLKGEEAGVLFISEDHRVQFPSDIRVFFVAPPALDEIHRWVRDHQGRGGAEAAPEEDA